MMYATCAKVGCYNKIEYDSETMKVRPRYCPNHMNYDVLMKAGAFWIATNIDKSTYQDPLPRELNKSVELRCPLCKLRITVPESKTGYKQACKTYGCEGTMIYHKDVEDVR